MRNVARKLRIRLRVALGKDVIIAPDVVCETERFGSVYGGWNIAVANIGSNSVIYSFGVGEDASFDTEIIRKYNCTVDAFDPTPRSIAWVNKQYLSQYFRMHEYGLAAYDGRTTFNPPDNPNYVSYTIMDRRASKGIAINVVVKTLGTIMNELGHKHIDILKMDIEGAEYGVIEYIRETCIRPDQILVEFHHRFPGVGVKKTKDAIACLRSMGYKLFFVSSTNEEYSFIRQHS